MKILEIIPQLSTGGAERLVVDLCNELSTNNDVSLLVFYNIKDHDHCADDLSDNVKLIALNKKVGFTPRLYKNISDIISKINPDIIHMHLNAINYLWPFALVRRSIKFFMTVHNDAAKESGGVLGTWLRKFMFRHKKIVPITISKQSLKSFTDYYKMDSVPLIFNGRKFPKQILHSQSVIEEFQKYRLTPNTKILVNVASVTNVKQQHVLAKVASRLWTEGYDFQILIIGRFACDEVVRQIKNIDCPRVHLLGEKSNPYEYMSLSDAFCLVSTYEGLPISLIEAMSVGLLPLCTPVGGIVDLVIDGDNGYLASDYTEEGIYKLLRRYLMTDMKVIDSMRQRVILTADEYSIENCSNNHMALFNR